MKWREVTMREALAFCQMKQLLHPNDRRPRPEGPSYEEVDYGVVSVEMFTDGTAVAALSGADADGGKYSPITINSIAPRWWVYDYE